MAARPRASEGRGREIFGILLLAAALFAGISLASMHAGRDRLMGPGGAATATGLYTAAGFAAYGLVLALAVVAIRCFRGVSVVAGFSEVLGAAGLLASGTVLLHLPSVGRRVALEGPGGLLGQWLGEITGAYIGLPGAVLAGATLLICSLLLITNVRIREVFLVLGWATRGAGSAMAAAFTTVARVVVAIFPAREEEPGRRGRRAREQRELEADAADSDDLSAIPSLMPVEEPSGAVRIGRPALHRSPTPAMPDDRDREAISQIVAEIEAAEPAALPPVAPVPEAFGPPVEASEPDSAAADETPKATAAQEEAAPPIVTPIVTPILAPLIVEPARTLRDRAAEERAEAEGPGFIKLGDGAFLPPSADLLDDRPPQRQEMDRQALYDMAERLEQALATYKVRGTVKEIHMGPVVTMYEFAPAPGTRTGTIVNLENDLAMALEAQAVRIVAPIPGKAVVGVEVPNRTREIVYLREILEDECFTGSTSKLQVALGKDIKGAPVSVNLAKMPHLLVAGTTGSGKSVAVNSMITSILFNATPDDVRFIMVDPKMLELSIYEGIPHLLLPVVTDPKKANLALRWAVEEMERRYEILATAGVRDISTFNARVEKQQKRSEAAREEPLSNPAKKLKVVIARADGTEEEVEVDAGIEEQDVTMEMDLPAEAPVGQAGASAAAEPPTRKLPYIVIVIDEFADLMMVAPKDVETSVARLAQKARAAGLHLILATQRPSVDVITGLIKANFPSRVALQVASKVDSRTILDVSGAETLLGNGDMLFSDRGTKLRRIHGAFLSDEEVHRIADFLKRQGKPVYDMEIIKPRDEDVEGGLPAESFDDELYDQAIAVVCETRQASVSYIQRRLQIGYNRAARMVEQMERDGIVGPANGAKPREVLAPPGEYLQAPA